MPYPGMPPTPPKRGPGRPIIIGLSLLMTACCGTAVAVGLPKFFNALDDATVTPTAPPPSGITATTEATAAPNAAFEGSPAGKYPEGEDGITLPNATAVSGFTKTKVTAALKKVKQGLIAARLDEKMLVKHDPSALTALLAPDARKSIQLEFTKHNFLTFASQIATGSELTSETPRVSGRITFRATTKEGIRFLEVITNFVWVYPLVGSGTDPGDNLVVVHDEVHWMFPVDSDVEKSSRGMWIDSAQGYASNIDCMQLELDQLSLNRSLSNSGGGSAADDESAFDPNRSLDINSTC